MSLLGLGLFLARMESGSRSYTNLDMEYYNFV